MRHSTFPLAIFLAVATLMGSICPTAASSEIPDFLAQMEHDRMEGYEARGHAWPITNFRPATDGWKKIMEERLAQVAEIQDAEMRFMGYLQTIYQSTLANFTEKGFAITRMPEQYLLELQKELGEEFDNHIVEDQRAIFDGPENHVVPMKDLHRVDTELGGYLREWAQTEIELTGVFGFRLYRGSGSFKMHIDKKGTHSLAFVAHIASSHDAEPWPFFVEDYQGQTHEVYLTPGDMIMYESNKLNHGRMRTLKGSWYCNIFAHYYPTDPAWKPLDHQQEAIYAVPPHWTEKAPGGTFPKLQFKGSGMYEPECADGWCRANSETTIKRNGPFVEHGTWMDSDGEKHQFIYRGTSTDDVLYEDL